MCEYISDMREDCLERAKDMYSLFTAEGKHLPRS
jgi:hypothetical protein